MIGYADPLAAGGLTVTNSPSGASASASVPPRSPKTCGLAVAGLLLGVVGPCTLGLAGVPALFVSIGALTRIRESAGALKGKGFAVAGMIVAVLNLLLLVAAVLCLFFLPAVLVPAVVKARDEAGTDESKNVVKQLCVAARSYSLNNADRLPPADAWPEALQMMGVTDTSLEDPAEPGKGRAFAMNAFLAEQRLGSVPRPSETVLFFECAPGAPPGGGPDALPRQPRHAQGYVIGFADGHVEQVAPPDLNRLIWNPRE